MEETRHITRSAKAFFSGTILSRISGMGRDVIMAFLFGTSSSIATFMLAFRFSNLLRRLLAESPLSSSFVPFFESLKGHDEKRSAEFFKNTFYSLLVITVGLTLILEVVLRVVANCSHQDISSVIQMVHIMLPSVIFIAFYGLSSALLQCERSFFIPSVSPVAFNVIWIVFALGAFFFMPSQVGIILSFGVLLAFVFQWLVTLPHVLKFLLKHLKKKECLKFRLFSPDIQAMGKPFFLGMLGVGATQINTALDSVFATLACSEGPAYLWYAIRIQQVPMALFGVALSSAMLPSLTRALRDEKYEEYHKLVLFGLKKAAALMIFATLGIFLCGLDAVTLLFQRGAFDLMSTTETTRCLYCYAIGLVFQGLVLVMTPAFYASKDYKTPMKISVASVISNIFLNSLSVFYFNLGAEGIALSTSLASFLQCILLWKIWKKRWEANSLRKVFLQIKTTLVCLVLPGILVYFFATYIIQTQTGNLLLGKVIREESFRKTLLSFVSSAGMFLGGCLLCAKLLKEETLMTMIKGK